MLLVGLHSDRFINWLLRLTSRARRKVRPWLRSHGIDLLPPRRRKRYLQCGSSTREPDLEILEVGTVFTGKLKRGWSASHPWLRRVITVGITVLIFVWMFRPVAHYWDDVRGWLTKRGIIPQG